ncbi:hypothetical protein D1AOALGA4SA_5153 [Olavius algarvensis Delta 1 endosymbiont]|nr:hypothetical protein D1AOALGA4SA_5153 [Olavius algarvensis Delta 1 endosymbiont]
MGILFKALELFQYCFLLLKKVTSPPDQPLFGISNLFHCDLFDICYL